MNSPERYSDVNNDIIRAINFYTKCKLPVNELEESTNMCYAWESSMNEAKDEGREEGRVEGRLEGREEGRVEGREEGKEELMQLFSWLKEAGRLEEAIAIMDQENIDLRNKLFEEFKAN